jgi:hypothetical protein
MFSADKSRSRMSDTKNKMLLSLSDSTRQMLMHLSRQLVFLSVHPASQNTLSRFQTTGRDGYVTFVLDMGCHNATSLLQEVRSNGTTSYSNTHPLFFHTIYYFLKPVSSYSFINQLTAN